jgi:hypothetical protein
MDSRLARQILVLVLAGLLGGCELLGMEDPAKVAAAKEADGKAIGGACRHSGRALEDCYLMNGKAMKSAVYAGWRDMDAYMRDNKIENIVPDLVDAPGGGKPDKAAAEEAKPADGKKKAADDKKAPTKHSSVATRPLRLA